MRVGVGGRDEVCVCARVRIACACAWSRGELALWTPRTPVAIHRLHRLTVVWPNQLPCHPHAFKPATEHIREVKLAFG